MEQIITFLSPLISDEQMLRYAVVIIVAGTFLLFGLGLGYLLLGASDPVRRRLGKPQQKSVTAAEKGRSIVLINTVLGPVSKYILPQEEIERSKISARLVHAGFRSPTALQTFYALKIVAALILPMLFLFVAQWIPELGTGSELMYALAISAAGLIIPSVVLDKLLEKRLKRLRHGFPDALDMLVVCVEAGLGMSQAIQRVADELIVSHPELATELSLVNAEIRAGVDRVVALKNLAERTGLEDIKGLVSLLVQTLRFGTSVAESLRVYSDEFRDKRMQKAEEAAAKIGTKLIFPLIFFMFPGFFVIAVGPAMVGLMSVFRSP
ncbi:MAG TPA: type II secretion system F family protein [Gammaproteobacteria bacterium]